MKRCPSCKRDISKGGHFVPPSIGDPGFFACDSILEAEKKIEEDKRSLANTVIVESYASGKLRYYYHKTCFKLQTVLDQNRVAEVPGTATFEAFEKDEFDGEQHECFVCEASI